jgi:hypothetical protein
MKQYSFCLFTTAVFANRIIFKNSKKTLPPPPLESVDLYYEIGWRIKFIALIAAFFIPFNLLTFHYFSYVLLKADYRKGMDKSQFWMSDSESLLHPHLLPRRK